MTPHPETTDESCLLELHPTWRGAAPRKSPPLQRVQRPARGGQGASRTLEPSLASAVALRNCFSRTVQIYPAIYPHQSCASRAGFPSRAGRPTVECCPRRWTRPRRHPMGFSHYQRMKTRAGNCVDSLRIRGTSAESTDGWVNSVSLLLRLLRTGIIVGLDLLCRRPRLCLGGSAPTRLPAVNTCREHRRTINV